jgi:hypothetical protein
MAANKVTAVHGKRWEQIPSYDLGAARLGLGGLFSCKDARGLWIWVEHRLAPHDGFFHVSAGAVPLTECPNRSPA